MVKVELFGQFRLSSGVSELEVEAKTLKELLERVHQTCPGLSETELKHASLFVNEKAVTGLFRHSKRLAHGDTVFIMNLACGG